MQRGPTTNDNGNTKLGVPPTGQQRLLAAWMHQPHLMSLIHPWVARLDPGAQQQVMRRHAEMTQTLAQRGPLPPATPPSLRALGARESQWVAEVMATPLFQIAFQGAPVSSGWVSVDRLIAFQPFLNASVYQPPTDPEELVRWCIPKEFTTTAAYNLDQQRVVFMTTDPNSQFAVAPTPNGVTLGMNPRPNWVQVVRVGDELVVKNGYHRIAALIAAGHTEVPALVATAPSLDAVIPPTGPWFGASYLSNLERPPLVTDFFDGRLTLEIPRPASRRVVVVKFSVDEVPVPLDAA